MKILISLEVFTLYSMVLIMLAYDFKPIKKMLQLHLAHVSFVVRILSQPRTSKMIWMLTVDKSLINRMRSHLQQLIGWWKSFNAVIWFQNLYLFCSHLNASFDILNLNSYRSCKIFLLILVLDNLGGINTSKISIKSFWGIYLAHE